MTQNFERNLTQAMKEVLASIDPNYTFDKERNCYIAHDKERNDSVIMFAYEKPFTDSFGYTRTDIITATNIFRENFTVFANDTVNELKETITRRTAYIRNTDKILQIIKESFLYACLQKKRFVK